MSITLPDLPYDYSALEPHIDARTMEIHHGKHHRAYVDKTNAAIAGTECEDKSIEELIGDLELVPEGIRPAVRSSGGGVINHNIFWTVLSPDGGGEPSGAFAEALAGAFGDSASFRRTFTDAALGQFGSGWAWLVLSDGALAVMKTPNQDSPLTEGRIPLLCLDVWEHAYYLKYQNRRPEYVEVFWNIVNWEEVGRRYEEGMA